jgi:hypothetical protein
MTTFSSERGVVLVETAVEVVGYWSQRFITGVKEMLNKKRFASRIFTTALSMTLLSSVFVAVPTANAADGPQNPLFAVAERQLLQLHETTPLSATGGSGDGLHQYSTTTPSLCSVSSTGLVTALAPGECSVSVTRGGSGNYLAATSPAYIITISDIDAEAAAAIVTASISTITYTLSSSSNTIEIDLADKYWYQIVNVDVKKKVLVSGKYVLRYVRIDTVVLDEFAAVTLNTTIGIKAGDVIRVSVIGAVTDTPVKYVTVK